MTPLFAASKQLAETSAESSVAGAESSVVKLTMGYGNSLHFSIYVLN
jgi:hypothetical protein